MFRTRPDDDSTLLNRFIRGGDQISFQELVRCYERTVMAACINVLGNPHDAEEAAQAAFLTLAAKCREIDASRCLAGWLFTVARQKALDYRKVRGRRNARFQPVDLMSLTNDSFPAGDETTNPSTAYSRQEIHAELDAAIAELPATDRDIVVLHHLQGLRLKDIAEALGQKPNAVSMRLQRARERLRTKLGRRGLSAASLTALTGGTLHAEPPSLSADFSQRVAAEAHRSLQTGAASLPTTASGLPFSVKAGVAATASVGIALLAAFGLPERGAANAKTDSARATTQPPAPVESAASTTIREPEAEAAPPFDLVSFRGNWTDERHFRFKAYLETNGDSALELRNEKGETLLNAAARYGNCEATLFLLRAGADPNLPDAEGTTPLMHAIRHRDGRGYLLRDMLTFKGADVNAISDDGDTALNIAVKENDYLDAEFLLWLGADLRPAGLPRERLPYFIAWDNGYSRLAELIQAAESPPPLPATQSPRIPEFVERAFNEAASRADFAKLEQLLAEGADINGRDESGTTALHRAARSLQHEVVTYLLFMGADPNVARHNGHTPLMATQGWLGWEPDWMRYMLLLAGANPHAARTNGHTELSHAAFHANEHGVQMLIWAGADPEEVTPKGSPMHIASKAGHQRVVELLRRNGVTEAPFESDDPAWRLHHAARRGDIESIVQLVESGVSPDLPGENGLSPMMNAIHSRRIDVARKFVELGADPNFKVEKDGTTPLMATIAWNYWEVNHFREELIRAGADPNLPDKSSRSPLIQAAKHGTMGSTLSQLLLFGADINYRDKHGRSALDYARESSRNGAAAYLIEMGAEEPTIAETNPSNHPNNP